ncbi:ice-binding family protein [Pseudolysinimonas sp.]|uniref:ice-binding family protein n=1 Tax=Pseudolysinimonas sp. TaxID=2680009 RepID=UPI00286B6ADB|nr:ice-binding family protein [Pseudolysinimonas sp.]
MSNQLMQPRVAPISIALAALLTVGLVAFAGPLTAHAAEPGDDDFLGTAEVFAIIASDTITETATNETVVVGDVALDPGTVVELLPVQVSGDIHISDTVSIIADADLNTAYVILANTGATETVGTTNLAARVTPYLAGVYFSASDLLLDGTITLFGSADDVFIFQASTGALTIESGSVVQIIGGVQACNVYWQVGSSATLGTNSTVVGTILAATSISALNGAEIEGQLFAGATNAGAVTLDNNVIDSGTTCLRTSSTTPTETTPTGTAGPAELAETGWDADSPLILGIGAAIILLGSLLLVGSRRIYAAVPQ